MKKLLTLAAIFALAGCTSLNQSAPSSWSGPKVDNCLNAETQVGGDTSGTSTTTRILGFIKFGDSEYADGVGYGVSSFGLGLSDAEDTKAAAAYKAIKKSGADTLVAPKYVVEEYNFFGIYKTTKATVNGRSGKTGKIVPVECKHAEIKF
jgi:hypothetical protein